MGPGLRLRVTRPWNTAHDEQNRLPEEGTAAGGQSGWGGTPVIRNHGPAKVGSPGTETRGRVQGQKPA